MTLIDLIDKYPDGSFILIGFGMFCMASVLYKFAESIGRRK